jgi:hypothetical protein
MKIDLPFDRDEWINLIRSTNLSHHDLTYSAPDVDPFLIWLADAICSKQITLDEARNAQLPYLVQNLPPLLFIAQKLFQAEHKWHYAHIDDWNRDISSYVVKDTKLSRKSILELLRNLCGMPCIYNPDVTTTLPEYQNVEAVIYKATENSPKVHLKFLVDDIIKVYPNLKVLNIAGADHVLRSHLDLTNHPNIEVLILSYNARSDGRVRNWKVTAPHLKTLISRCGGPVLFDGDMENLRAFEGDFVHENTFIHPSINLPNLQAYSPDFEAYRNRANSLSFLATSYHPSYWDNAFPKIMSRFPAIRIMNCGHIMSTPRKMPDYPNLTSYGSAPSSSGPQIYSPEILRYVGGCDLRRRT